MNPEEKLNLYRSTGYQDLSSDEFTSVLRQAYNQGYIDITEYNIYKREFDDVIAAQTQEQADAIREAQARAKLEQLQVQGLNPDGTQFQIDLGGRSPEDLASAALGGVQVVQAGTPPKGTYGVDQAWLLSNAQTGFQTVARTQMVAVLARMVSQSVINQDQSDAILDKYDQVIAWKQYNGGVYNGISIGVILAGAFAGVVMYYSYQNPQMLESVTELLYNSFRSIVFGGGVFISLYVGFVFIDSLVSNNYDVGKTLSDLIISLTDVLLTSLKTILEDVLPIIAGTVIDTVESAANTIADDASNWWDAVKSESSSYTRMVIATVDKWVEAGGNQKVAIASASDLVFQSDQTSSS